jgi:hypothetical protein
MHSGARVWRTETTSETEAMLFVPLPSTEAGRHRRPLFFSVITERKTDQWRTFFWDSEVLLHPPVPLVF